VYTVKPHLFAVCKLGTQTCMRCHILLCLYLCAYWTVH